MKMRFFVFIMLSLDASFVFADQSTSATPAVVDYCQKELSKMPGKHSDDLLKSACAKTKIKPECQSVQGKEIFYYERMGKKNAKKILVFSLIHGDEFHAGAVGRYWMERLEEIDPRNSWRVIPILNPDGFEKGTRVNARNIDLNRNFPTKNWESESVKYWTSQQKNPRRFPGATPASEPEVKCAISHIEEFKPDFVLSVHTPLNVLDYDGPKIKPPVFEYIPWKSLGTFPGSLGRFMWGERKTPVLTMELKDRPPADNKPFEKLQDVIGTLVLIQL